jgi:hypothetical protein
MTPNRLVALATPLVFAPLAGAVAAWLAEHFPGIEIDQSALEAVFIAGALIALAPAAQWLHGWQKYEARQADAARDLAVEPKPTPEAFAAAGLEEEAESGDLEDLDDLESLADLEDLEDLDELDELEDDFLAEDEEPAGVGT